MSETLAKSDSQPAATDAAAPTTTPTLKVITLQWSATWLALASLAAVITLCLNLAKPAAGVGYAYALATMVCLIAALTDAATGVIPNKLTYPAMIAGLVLAIVTGIFLRFDTNWSGRVVQFLSAPTIRDCLLGFGVCAAIGILSWLLSGLGEGDLKLIAAIGALLGLSASLKVLLLALCVAVPYALINILIAGKFNTVLCEAAWRIMQLLAWGKIDQRDNIGPATVMPPHKSIPLAVPILAGMIAWQLVPAAWLAPITGG